MIKYLIENGYPINLTSSREDLPPGQTAKIRSEVKVFTNEGKELYSQYHYFFDNDSRKAFINGIIKGMEIALR